MAVTPVPVLAGDPRRTNRGAKGKLHPLPDEAGYEELTLELAKKWGADVIREAMARSYPMRIPSRGMTSIPPSASCAPTTSGPMPIPPCSSSAPS
jgi:hypothetical protein